MDKNEILMSKNQLKKLRKKENWEMNKEKIKLQYKEKQKKKKEIKKELKKTLMTTNDTLLLNNDLKLTDDIVLDCKVNIINNDIESGNNIIKNLTETKKDKLTKFLDLSTKGIPIIIDCGFEELMMEKEIHSMANQINFIYSRFRKMHNPFRLILFNVGEKTYISLNKQGFSFWKGVEVIKSSENLDWNYLSSHLSKDLMYLTGDSSNEITSISNHFAYIIGGIVDRNRYKGLTLKIAEDNSLRHGKLPISNYIGLKTSQILTTNHVFDLLASFSESDDKDWKKAFETIIPKRKIINS